MSLLLLFLLGLAVGSFLNVLALRHKKNGRILTRDILFGRSRCRACRKTLVWYELIPLFSFLWQKGKCRHCHEPLSRQYPLVEFGTAVIFALTGSYLYPYGLWLVIFSALILVALIDFRMKIIPDQMNLLLLLAGGALVATNQIGFLSLTNHIIGLLAGFGLIGLIVVLTDGKGMGEGDWKMAAALGFIFGWPQILVLLALGFIVGGLFACGILAVGKKTLGGTLPFGPFLVISSLITAFWGEAIVRWYF